MKYSICNELFKDWKLEDVFDYLSKLGYHGIEIAPFTLAEDVRYLDKRYRRTLSEMSSIYGVEIVGLHWLLVSPKGLHINHPDESIRRKTLEYMKALIDFNHDIGGRVLVFGSPKQRNILEGVSKERAWKFTVEFFKETSRYAEDRSSIIAFEPLARHLTNFINTVTEALKLVKDVNEEAFRIILDVYSMTDEGRPYSEIIKEANGFLVHFHANDTNKLGPGFGEADYKDIREGLLAIGYNGFLSVEVFDTSPGIEKIATESIRFLRKIFEG